MSTHSCACRLGRGCAWAALLLLAAAPLATADPATKVRIYVDADRTGTRAAGIAIEQGLRTALSEVGNRLAGRQVEIVVRDHRGSSPRSKRHLQEYLADSLALVLFSGLHSPPLLAHRQYINQSHILVLDPWAAAGPITRYPATENWIFRLSIDDTKAGYVIARAAVEEEGFTKAYLILEDTGWGKSNDRTMTRALREMGVAPVGKQLFNWNLGLSAAKIMLRKAAAAGADVIFLVANAPEGKTFARAMVALPKQTRLPIRSHWGITGGDFPVAIDRQLRSQLDLRFLQTRFSFVSDPENLLGQRVFRQAAQLFAGTISTVEDIKAPTGFIHAYDLTLLLITAVRQVGLTGDIERDRDNVRRALEDLHEPVTGLVKTYVKPFGVFDADHPDAHEALSMDDYAMAYYGDDGEIRLVKEQLKR